MSSYKPISECAPNTLRIVRIVYPDPLADDHYVLEFKDITGDTFMQQSDNEHDLRCYANGFVDGFSRARNVLGSTPHYQSMLVQYNQEQPK